MGDHRYCIANRSEFHALLHIATEGSAKTLCGCRVRYWSNRNPPSGRLDHDWSQRHKCIKCVNAWNKLQDEKS